METDELFTITFSESVENHIGMERIGEKLNTGFSIRELKQFKNEFESEGLTCKLVNLNKYLPEDLQNEVKKAKILIIKNGVSVLSDLEGVKGELCEQKELVDKKALMRGKVVNKIARWNLCYADYDQEPDYEEGKGRIINFADLTFIRRLRKNLRKHLRRDQLYAELNYYYDINKCGIGFHGDTERRLVIGVRIGASVKLHYQWYHKSQPIGKRAKISLRDGDIYIMSNKAVGWDWKKSSQYTLRHATGCEKYTT